MDGEITDIPLRDKIRKMKFDEVFGVQVATIAIFVNAAKI